MIKYVCITSAVRVLRIHYEFYIGIYYFVTICFIIILNCTDNKNEKDIFVNNLS